MRLELGHVNISDVQFGEETKIDKGVVDVNKEELITLITWRENPEAWRGD